MIHNPERRQPVFLSVRNRLTNWVNRQSCFSPVDADGRSIQVHSHWKTEEAELLAALRTFNPNVGTEPHAFVDTLFLLNSVNIDVYQEVLVFA